MAPASLEGVWPRCAVDSGDCVYEFMLMHTGIYETVYMYEFMQHAPASLEGVGTHGYIINS